MRSGNEQWYWREGPHVSANHWLNVPQRNYYESLTILLLTTATLSHNVRQAGAWFLLAADDGSYRPKHRRKYLRQNVSPAPTQQASGDAPNKEGGAINTPSGQF